MQLPTPSSPLLFPDSVLTAAAHSDPYPYYAALLSYRPIYREARIGMWVALGATAVRTVLESPLCRVRPATEPVPQAIADSSAGAVFGSLVRMNDGAKHAAMRPAVTGLVSAFDPSALTAIARRVAAAAVGEHGCSGAGIDRFARAYPVQVIAQMIGLPPETAPKAATLIGDFVRCLSPLSGPTQIEASKTAATRLLRLMEDCAAQNTHGGLPMLVDRLVSLGVTQRQAALANLFGLMSQTYDAAAGLIGNTLLALAGDPALRRGGAGDEALLRRIVQEVARHDPPVHNTRRYVAEDGIIAGQAMKQGDAILVVLAAANRDPAVNPYPHRFDPDRAEPHCFTFGHGRHACPGERMATTLAVIGLQALLDRGVPFEQFAAAPRYAASVNSRIPIFGAPVFGAPS